MSVLIKKTQVIVDKPVDKISIGMTLSIGTLLVSFLRKEKMRESCLYMAV